VAAVGYLILSRNRPEPENRLGRSQLAPEGSAPDDAGAEDVEAPAEAADTAPAEPEGEPAAETVDEAAAETADNPEKHTPRV
jgi:hypothetical protein